MGWIRAKTVERVNKRKEKAKIIAEEGLGGEIVIEGKLRLKRIKLKRPGESRSRH